jgi:[protein-PII] uridylyltransferase
MLSPFDELREARENLLERFSHGHVTESFREEYSEIMDQYFRRSLQESEAGRALFRQKKPFAFLAVGGYSRQELCLHSDIDIIIVFGSKIPGHARQLSDEIFFPLWDLGLDLGYGIRTLKDCLRLCKEDFEVLTSMMHARFLCGDSPLYLSLIEDLNKKVASKRAKAFGRWLEERNAVRMDKFGDASYLLEPNIKEGIGGLRDYHHLLWLARAFFQSSLPRDLEYLGILSHNEYEELNDSLRFIWLVRNHLHRLSGRRNDRLVFEHQEEIAQILGFTCKGDVLAVEQFMGELHARMAGIKSLHRSFVSSQIPTKRSSTRTTSRQGMPKGLTLENAELGFVTATAITNNPWLLLDIFGISADSGIPISMEGMRLIREFLFLVDKDFRHSVHAAERFHQVLRADSAGDALNQMFEAGFLEAYIPEFSMIRDRVQFDAYHIYPVGRHCIETLRRLKNLDKQEDLLLLDILAEIPQPEHLLLAALFHDIGKVGKDHSNK